MREFLRNIYSKKKRLILISSILSLFLTTILLLFIFIPQDRIGGLHGLFYKESIEEDHSIESMLKEKIINGYKLYKNGMLEKGVIDTEDGIFYVTSQYFYKIKGDSLIEFELKKDEWNKIDSYEITSIGEREGWKYLRGKFKNQYNYNTNTIDIKEVKKYTPPKLSEETLEGMWEEEYSLSYIGYSSDSISKIGLLFKDGKVYMYQLGAYSSEEEVIENRKNQRVIIYESYKIEGDTVVVNNMEMDIENKCTMIGSHLYCGDMKLVRKE